MNAAAVIAAERGGLYLDDHTPGWWKPDAINLDDLDMSAASLAWNKGCGCVVVQLDKTLGGRGDWFGGRDKLGLVGTTTKQMEHLGFEHSDEFEYSDLDEAWAYIINERRSIAQLGSE